MVIVETQAGKVRGKEERNFKGDQFFAFRGIPYAKPPVGKLRFQDPQPVEPWTEVREAFCHGPNCPQPDYITMTEIIGDDDCLYLNVYTKSLESGKKLPVMFWIHGGGFMYGSGDDTFHAPDFFMMKDVVLITINYRLGVFGFLNLNDEVATGNQGLKDQVMALKWVRDNIVNFGGDPDNVTIFGQSAGGASVHYLCLSPLAKGLFHKAIAQSGVALNPWAFHPDSSERAYQLCELLGQKGRDPNLAVTFLRKVDIRKLVDAQHKLLPDDKNMHYAFSFGPSVDSKSKNPFMPVDLNEAVKQGINVPLIIGHTSREGMALLMEMELERDKFNEEWAELFHPNTVDTMRKFYQLSPENLKNIYLKKGEKNDDNLEKLVDMFGDLYFVEGIHRVIKTQIEKNTTPTYLYQFSCDQEPSMFKQLAKTKMSGVCHAEDLTYLFVMKPSPTMKQQYSVPKKSWYKMAKWCILSLPFKLSVKYGHCGIPKEGSIKYDVIEQMIDMWVNFATTGQPIPKPSESILVDWQPVNDVNSFNFLNIDEVLSIEVEQNLEFKYASYEDSDNETT